MGKRMLIEVHEEYMAVLILIAVIHFHYMLTAARTGTLRMRVFSKEYLETNFKEMH